MVGDIAKLPVNNFEWIKDTSPFKEDFIKIYNEESGQRYFLEVDAQYLEKLHELRNDLPFSPERIKIEKVENFVANLHNKITYVIHKKFKTSTKLWTSFEKSSHIKQIQSKSLAKIIY